jgi:hypothetical protein
LTPVFIADLLLLFCYYSTRFSLCFGANDDNNVKRKQGNP